MIPLSLLQTIWSGLNRWPIQRRSGRCIAHLPLKQNERSDWLRLLRGSHVDHFEQTGDMTAAVVCVRQRVLVNAAFKRR